jgi:hypothetical protein
MGRGPGLGHHELQIEELDLGLAGDLRSGAGRDETDFGLDPGEDGEDVEPGLEPGIVGEERVDFRRAPQVGVDRGTAHALESSGLWR